MHMDARCIITHAYPHTHSHSLTLANVKARNNALIKTTSTLLLLRTPAQNSHFSSHKHSPVLDCRLKRNQSFYSRTKYITFTLTVMYTTTHPHKQYTISHDITCTVKL